MEKIKNFIGGKFLTPISKKYLENYDPAKGEIYSLVPDSDSRDIKTAVDMSSSVFPFWSNLPLKDRSNYLMKIAHEIEKNLEMLAIAESKDNGKPLWLCKSVDIPRAASNFKFFASCITQFSSKFYHTSSNVYNYVLKQPIGIAGCISPWNLPLYLLTWKIAPALAAGNCVIAKPSELTPMTAHLLAKICKKIELPDGVLNIIHGRGENVGEEIVQNKNIPVISFTGGTKTGKKIAVNCATRMKKFSLELGGKNPNIIFSDCNFDLALKTTIKSSFSNQGQICLCGSRIFIQKKIYKKFVKEFVKETKKIIVGPPSEKKSQLGALISENHLKKIEYYVDLAKKEGGKILTGGEKVNLSGKFSKGYYYKPTIIEGLDMNCKVNKEEIFGPVVTVIPFDSEQEVIFLANQSDYGLSSSIWTENLTTAHKVSSKLDSGIIWVNSWLLRDLRTPFGGMKNSGIGREGGYKSLEFFTETKNVCLNFD
ncbi:MAG: aldehyde dehydrogenase [Flavobacteriales bacterium TMED288]|nr:2-hydroxymuconic semialdehyde dehydrogenase [Flavobacteriales bacterium]RPG52950.1 MAG: aldehyde dehydrogenase [Flavobacteriales bacterium TMED288]|tara:strand:- start:24 stop:1469 length:1446 start_codon:yes stop_codon:yes gene_type:complete